MLLTLKKVGKYTLTPHSEKSAKNVEKMVEGVPYVVDSICPLSAWNDFKHAVIDKEFNAIIHKMDYEITEQMINKAVKTIHIKNNK